jgi:hypothetical protein
MDLLKRYREEITNDLILNDFNIKETQLKLPARKHFWAARLIDAKIDYQKLIKQKKTLKKDIVKKIQQESPVKLTQQTAETIAENSNEVESLNTQIKEFEYVIEYLEKVEKIFQNIHWEIKNIIMINQSERL